MEGYETWEELKERVMSSAPKLEDEESGTRDFALNDLAHELGMEDVPEKRQLSIIVNQLVNEGQLLRHPGLNGALSIGSG
jgi:hypothetical protein